jgi:hypothetical protein
MASYQSIPAQYNKVVEPLDVDLMGKVLMAKEGQTNANIAQIDETLGQLKIQENMLIGDQRKARFANNVQTLLDEVNRSGKLNLQSGDFTRRMKNYITTALDDYTLDHISKANSIRAFQADVAEKQKKGDGSYSTVNVNDALELAGASDYINEQSDNLGNLQYQDYVNVPEKLNKKADEYVKTMGIEKLLDSTTGEYYFSDVYGKRVTQDEIYNRISSELDEKDRAQLQINTRQSLGKMSPNELELTVNPIITQKLTQTKEGRARLEAQIASETDKVKKDNLKLQLVNFDNKIDNYSKQLENKNYNLYSLYEEQLLNSVASNYDIEAITSIKRDNLPLEIKKFEFDQISKQREYDLKLREVEAKEAETQALTSPTIIEKTQTGDTQKPSEQILNEAVVDADKALDAYLKKSNENGYNQKTPNEQWAYKISLKTGDPSLTIEKQNLIKNFNTALEGKVKIINEAKNLLKGSTAEMYNNITGAKIDNLSTEMPYTVAMLKQGKKFEELDANQQSAVMLEMGSNVAKHMATGREKNILMSSLNALNAQLANHKSEKVQQIYNIAKNSLSRTEKAPAFTPISAGKTGTIFLPTFLLSTSPIQDTDVTELERYTGDANVDGVDVFKGMLNQMKLKAEEISDGYKSNLVSNNAMAWSTEDKGQKNDALRIQQAIQTQYPELKLPNTNNFIVSRKGDGFEVSFDVKNGTQTERVTQSLNTLSEDVMNKINLQEQKWHSNFNNPNLVLPEFSFSPKMKNASYETFKNIAKNRPDIVPPDAYVALHNRGSLAGTEFQSDEDIMDWVESQPTLTADKQPKISAIINATYTTKYELFNGVLQGNIYVTTPDGKQDLIIMNSRQRELDEGKLYIETMQKVNEYKVKKITDILNGGNR